MGQYKLVPGYKKLVPMINRTDSPEKNIINYNIPTTGPIFLIKQTLISTINHFFWPENLFNTQKILDFYSFLLVNTRK